MTWVLRQFAPVALVCLFSVAAATPSHALGTVDRYLMDMKSPNVEVRNKAAYELGCGCSKPSRVVPPLINLLKDPVPKVRATAATSLGAFHAAATQIVPALLARLDDEDMGVRRAIVVSLGMLGQGSDDAEKAVATYMNDPDPAMKRDAVVAWAAMGKRDDTIIPLLIEALGSKEEGTANATRKALTEIGSETPKKVVPGLVATLDKKGDPRAVNAVRVLGALRKNAAPYTRQIAHAYDGTSPKDRHYVIDALLAVDESGEQTIPVLNKALDAIDSLDRHEAILGLMKFRSNPPAIVPTLVRAFRDASQENRLLAVSIVRGMGEPAMTAIPALLPLTEVPDVKMRKAALSAIGSVRPSSPSVIPVLQKALNDKEFDVRLVAVYALKRVAEVSQDEGKKKIADIFQSAYDSETDPRMKQALQTALPQHAQPPAAAQHSKADTPDNKHESAAMDAGKSSPKARQ